MEGSRPTRDVPLAVQGRVSREQYEYLHGLGEVTLSEALREAIRRAMVFDHALSTGQIDLPIDEQRPDGEIVSDELVSSDGTS